MTDEDDQPPAFSWRGVVACGLLWGVVVVAAIGLTSTISDLQPLDAAVMMGDLLIEWVLVGFVWSCGAKLAEGSRRPRLGLLATLALAWLVSFGPTFLPVFGVEPGGGGHIVHSLARSLDLVVYTLWLNLLYGGLYAFGYFAMRRMQRLRRRLAQIRLARASAEAQARETRLGAVRGQMQPAMLLEALAALQRTYARDRQAGERLFDLLIGFLRAAMPGLRSGASTLSDELAVVDRYAALRAQLDTGPPVWRLALERPPADLPFPPLRLLPALDRMSRATPPDATVEVAAGPGPDAFLVRIGLAPGRPLPAPVLQGLRAGLRRDLGPLLHADTQGPQLGELRVRPPLARPAA